MLLVVLSEEPVECDQIPAAKLPMQKNYSPGTSYEAIRREAVEASQPSLVTEFRAPADALYVDLHYEKDQWAGEEPVGWTCAESWATASKLAPPASTVTCARS